MSALTLREAERLCRQRGDREYLADWLGSMATDAALAEKWCPDLTRPGCNCGRCEKFRPAIAVAEYILAHPGSTADPP